MAGKITTDEEFISEINIVPFVDIILVVLIIFMVTAPMIAQQALDIKLSQSSSASKAKDAQVNIGITGDGKISFNGQKIATDDLSSFVNNIIQTKPNARAVISADKSVSHGVVVTVIDAVKAGGIDNFAIMVGKK